jgi:hypothetical protein
MHGKLVQEAKKETAGFWGEERKRRSIMSSQGFLLGFGGLLGELLIFSAAPVSC